MKRLPPAKRNQLIVVIIATLGLISLVYFLLIGPQNNKNREVATDIGTATLRLQQMKTSIKQMEATTSTLADLNQQLIHAEEDVAAGDLYAWTSDTIRRFKAGYHVEIPNPSRPDAPTECDLIGNFPYKQIKFSLAGTAYYHDLGKFVSDFENKFPHCRVLNLTADPLGNNPNGGEHLNFRMDVVALVKPNS